MTQFKDTIAYVLIYKLTNKQHIEIYTLYSSTVSQHSICLRARYNTIKGSITFAKDFLPHKWKINPVLEFGSKY